MMSTPAAAVAALIADRYFFDHFKGTESADFRAYLKICDSNWCRLIIDVVVRVLPLLLDDQGAI